MTSPLAVICPWPNWLAITLRNVRSLQISLGRLMLSSPLGVGRVHDLSLAQDGSSCPEEVCALLSSLPPQHLVQLLLGTMTPQDLFSFLQFPTPSSTGLCTPLYLWVIFLINGLQLTEGSFL